jgi:hypothetical protein
MIPEATAENTIANITEMIFTKCDVELADSNL